MPTSNRPKSILFRLVARWPPFNAIDVDEQYFAMLPTGSTEITAKEADEFARVFGKNGELRAERLS